MTHPSVGAGGVPTSGNPSVSFALPGPAVLGVPNFFIQSFAIPPFLLPIYQAAGIQYDVPWQVLAAINEIETDYGRNLSVSSAGAVGWMQFLPSTWRRWGVAATGDGIADPYNPVDAIFSAARYLQAAGASKNLAQAIFAYNHANWYVQSVLLRARLIGGLPSSLLGALSDLVQGHFPIAARSTYADSNRLAASGGAVASDTATGTTIYSQAGAPVVAVNDGRIVKLGSSRSLGRYIELQDQTGNVYVYSHLGSIPRSYPVPKPLELGALQIARELSDIINPQRQSRPQSLGGPASAGSQQAPRPSSGPIRLTLGTERASTTARASLSAHAASPRGSTASGSGGLAGALGAVKERLFANPSLPGSYGAGGAEQLAAQAQIQNFSNYFADALHLARDQYTLKPLRAGAVVVAGTILAHLGRGTAQQASHMYFQIRPAGKHSPLIDPKPILDGWKLLAASAAYRAAGVDPFFGPGAKNPSIGQMLLESKTQIEQQALTDAHVQMSLCTQRQIRAGQVDERLLKAIEYLSLSGLAPTIETTSCQSQSAGPNQSALAADAATIDITAINHIPILHHQGQGSITDIAIRRLLTLQGALSPTQIISLTHIPGQNSVLTLPDHQNRIQITYTPTPKTRAQIQDLLKPHQWIQLITRISQIPEPTVPTAPTRFSIRTNVH